MVLDIKPLEPSAKQYPFTPPACGELGNACETVPGIGPADAPVARPNVDAFDVTFPVVFVEVFFNDHESVTCAITIRCKTLVLIQAKTTIVVKEFCQ